MLGRRRGKKVPDENRLMGREGRQIESGSKATRMRSTIRRAGKLHLEKEDQLHTATRWKMGTP